MTPVNPLPEGEAVRRLIVDAAEARIRIYGYRKATMAEIAEDVDMSAANLYRYFEKNRIEQALIAAILAEGHASGQFDVADPIAIAKSVHSAIVLFLVPIFMALNKLEELENAARGVVALLVRGLARRIRRRSRVVVRNAG